MNTIVTEKRCSKCGKPEVYEGRRCSECVNESHRKWYRKNIEHSRKTANARNTQRRGVLREWARNWHLNNPGKDAEYHKKYYDKHPEKFQQKNARSRAKKKSAEGSISSVEWLKLLNRYENKCLCCGKKAKLEMDHVVPLSLGGRNSIDNIQPLCRSCNARKGGKTIDYR